MTYYGTRGGDYSCVSLLFQAHNLIMLMSFGIRYILYICVNFVPHVHLKGYSSRHDSSRVFYEFPLSVHMGRLFLALGCRHQGINVEQGQLVGLRGLSWVVVGKVPLSFVSSNCF